MFTGIGMLTNYQIYCECRKGSGSTLQTSAMHCLYRPGIGEEDSHPDVGIGVVGHLRPSPKNELEVQKGGTRGARRAMCFRRKLELQAAFNGNGRKCMMWLVGNQEI